MCVFHAMYIAWWHNFICVLHYCLRGCGSKQHDLLGGSFDTLMWLARYLYTTYGDRAKMLYDIAIPIASQL